MQARKASKKVQEKKVLSVTSMCTKQFHQDIPHPSKSLKLLRFGQQAQIVNGILTRHVLRNIFYKSPNLSGSAMLDINMLFVLALMSKQGECMFGGGLHFAIEIVELIQR